MDDSDNFGHELWWYHDDDDDDDDDDSSELSFPYSTFSILILFMDNFN